MSFDSALDRVEAIEIERLAEVMLLRYGYDIRGYAAPWLILTAVALAVVLTLPRLSPLVQRG